MALRVSKAVTAAGVLENGFSLSNYRAAKPIIESEGTAVYDPSGSRIGTIRRLMIEKVSGKVLYADITFGGFLGLGEHHHAIPWEKLHLRQRARRIWHRHHSRAGQGCSGLLRR